MAGAKFDILFAGELMRDADPEAVRRQLQQRYSLSDEAADKLFSGRTVTIKRGVDTATATRYREIFREAKALVRIQPVETRAEVPPAPPVTSAKGPAVADLEAEAAGSESEKLRLVTPAEQQSKPLEQPGHVDSSEIDISHLHLVPGQNWTLSDGEPPPTTVDLPDTSHLRLVTPAPDSGEERED